MLNDGAGIRCEEVLDGVAGLGGRDLGGAPGARVHPEG